ncbi:MAG: DUF935 family protein, partial [bacterium]|nr:DUF935 family protein [bacterium]
MATANGTETRSRPEVRSIGFTGIQRWGGLISEDYLPALAATKRIGVYARMRSDGMIQAILSALQLPIIAAAWVVEPAGQDAKAQAAAALVEEQLFQRLGCCWEDEVRQLLAYLQYGFHCAAKNWRLEGGQVVLDELRPLHPRTILQGGRNWQFDEQGHVTGVWQYGTDGVNWREELIPGEALLLLTHMGDYGNPEGQSVLRAPYKHWLVKDTLYRVQAIGLERAAVGTPIGKYPQGAAKGEQDDFLTSLERLIVNESGAIVIPNGADGQGYSVENFSLELKTPDIMAAIHHHDAEIAKSVLAGFLNLGQEGAGGAYALSTDQTDLFLLSLEAIADYLCARINRSIIPQMVSYNLATDQYPKLSATISRRSASALAGLLQPLTAGTLTWGEGDEDWMREQLQLPGRQEPRPARMEPAQKPLVGSGARAPED